MPPEVQSVRIDPVILQATLEKKLADLPPLPVAVTRIMQAVTDPNTSAEDLNKLISMDQGLASKVLRVVNSSYYGFPKRISTITHAVLMLGFSTVRNLVLGVSAFGLMGQKSMPYGLNRATFWEHSIATAVAGAVVARKRLPDASSAPDEAFVGGLLHDHGKLFLDSYFRVEFAVAMAYAARDKKTSIEAENRVLGINHTVVGRRIAECWNFPSHLVAIIGSHHEPARETEHFEMTALVHAGNWLAWDCGFIASEHTRQHPLDSTVVEWLSFDRMTMEHLKREVVERVKACEELLSLGRELK